VSIINGCAKLHKFSAILAVKPKNRPGPTRPGHVKLPQLSLQLTLINFLFTVPRHLFF